jgi:hypothetical protein
MIYPLKVEISLWKTGLFGKFPEAQCRIRSPETKTIRQCDIDFLPLRGVGNVIKVEI